MPGREGVSFGTAELVARRELARDRIAVTLGGGDPPPSAGPGWTYPSPPWGRGWVRGGCSDCQSPSLPPASLPPGADAARGVLVMIPYEAEAKTITPVTVHATTRQQIKLRLKMGRFAIE